MVLFFLFAATYCPVGNLSLALADNVSQRPSEGADIMVLVDSSASMRLSDPAQLRKQALASFASALAPNDRIALGQFAESAQILAPFELVRASTSLAERIAALGDSGEYTDIIAAVKLGAELFQGKGRAGIRKIMILISDGKMDPSPRKYAPAEATAKLLDELLPKVREAGIEVHTIALSEESDRDLMSRIASLTGGTGWYAQDASTIGDALREIRQTDKNPIMGGELTQRVISIDQELEEAMIYVRRTPGSRITIVSPGGKTYSGIQSVEEGERWFQNEEFVLLALENPEIGNWMIEGLQDPDEFIAVLKDLRAMIRWPSALFVGSEGEIEVLLLEGARPVSIPALSRAIRATVQVVSTERVAEPLVSGEMVDDGTLGDVIAGDGVFSRQAVVQELGSFKVLATLRAPFFELSAEQPFIVSPVLMRTVIEISPEPFSTLVKGYKNTADFQHGAHSDDDATAHGSHGVGGDEQQIEKNSDVADPSLELTETNRSGKTHVPSVEQASSPREGSGEHDDGQHEDMEPNPEGFPVIKVELAKEVLSYRRHDVTVTAVDDEGREHLVPLYRSVSREEVLFGNLADLPKPGPYRAQARLKLKKRLGLEQQYLGPWLLFERPKSLIQKPAIHKEAVSQSEVPVFLPFLLVALCNLSLGGFWGFVLIRRARLNRTEQVSHVQLDDLAVSLAELERIAKEPHISVDDPRFLHALNSLDDKLGGRESGGGVQNSE